MRCVLVTVVQTCALPIWFRFRVLYSGDLMSSGAGLADIVFVSIASSEGARDVCRTLNRQAGAGEEISELVMAYGTDMRSMMQRNGGCFRMHDVGIPGEAGAHGYITFRSEEHTSELQSLMRISYAVFCLKKKIYNTQHIHTKISK